MNTLKSKGRLSRECDRCGSTFWIYRYRQNQARFCSRKCVRTIHDQKCEICGTTFKPSNVGGRFCSQACFGRSEIGHKPWNLGFKAVNDERIRKSVEAAHAARRGQPAWNRGKKIGPSWNSGKKITTNTGRTHWEKGRTPWNKGKQLPRGSDCCNWKGGCDDEKIAARKSPEYREWRKAVFTRDDYTCRFCGKRGGRLNADHIKSFSQYPDLRVSVNNGRTLCTDCHKKTITYGNYRHGRFTKTARCYV